MFCELSRPPLPDRLTNLTNLTEQPGTSPGQFGQGYAIPPSFLPADYFPQQTAVEFAEQQLAYHSSWRHNCELGQPI